MGADAHEKAERAGTPWRPSRQKKRSRPPPGSSWVWLTEEMLGSSAWRAMRLTARRVVDRIIVEHCRESGSENGNLVVTYSDFERFGLRRPSIADAINEAVALGWVDVVERGGAAYADFRNPSRYALAWLDRKDGAPPSNRWKRFKSLKDARTAVRKALKRAKS